MKKLFVLALLLGGAYVGYRYFSRAAQIREYEKFADAWAYGETEEALRHAEGDAIRKTLRDKPLRALLDARMMEAFHGTSYVVQSVSSSPDGDVVLEAKQVVAFDPPGVTSAITGAMWVSFRQVATLRKGPGGWKVVSFEPTYLEMGEIRRR